MVITSVIEFLLYAVIYPTFLLIIKNVPTYTNFYVSVENVNEKEKGKITQGVKLSKKLKCSFTRFGRNWIIVTWT